MPTVQTNRPSKPIEQIWLNKIQRWSSNTWSIEKWELEVKAYMFFKIIFFTLIWRPLHRTRADFVLNGHWNNWRKCGYNSFQICQAGQNYQVQSRRCSNKISTTLSRRGHIFTQTYREEAESSFRSKCCQCKFFKANLHVKLRVINGSMEFSIVRAKKVLPNIKCHVWWQNCSICHKPISSLIILVVMKSSNWDQWTQCSIQPPRLRSSIIMSPKLNSAKQSKMLSSGLSETLIKWSFKHFEDQFLTVFGFS